MPSSLDLKGQLLTIATNESPPYVFLEYLQKWKLKSGIEVKLIQSLSKHFNFTYQVLNCNSDWGVFLPNKSWTGIIGAIVSKEADIGFAGLTITEERSRYVYFTEPHIITSVSYITPPPKIKPKLTLVIEPFDVLVWICIIVSMLLMLSIESLVAHKSIQYKSLHIKWGIISALLKQTLCCRPPNILELRIIIYFWLLACLVLTSSYSGCLYSLMTVSSKLNPINDLNELTAAQRNGQIQVTAIGGSSYFESLKNANFGVYKELGEELIAVKNKEEGLQVVMRGQKPSAYISTRDHLIYGLLSFGCNLIYLPPPTQESTLFVDIMGIAFQADFKHKQTFNNLISDLKKGGFIDYWRLFENRKLVSNAEQSMYFGPYRQYKILRLEQLQSAIYLLSFGLTVALIFLMIEIFLKSEFFNFLYSLSLS